MTLNTVVPDEPYEEPLDPEQYAELLLEAETLLAERRALPICQAMAHVGDQSGRLHPVPCYAWIVSVDLDTIPEAEILVKVGPSDDVRLLSLPNWPELDDSVARYLLAAAGPQLLLVRWYDQPVEGHDGLLIGICPGIFDPEPYIDVITCSDACDLSDKWPTRLRVLTLVSER
jgi:hypothetical protein